MEALGVFLKTALYRVVFVLIVGAPAVEFFMLSIKFLFRFFLEIH